MSYTNLEYMIWDYLFIEQFLLIISRWYFGNISSDEAKRFLHERGNVGSFLIRESRTQPGFYVLSIRYEHKNCCSLPPYIFVLVQYYVTCRWLFLPLFFINIWKFINILLVMVPTFFLLFRALKSFDFTFFLVPGFYEMVLSINNLSL